MSTADLPDAAQKKWAVMGDDRYPTTDRQSPLNDRLEAGVWVVQTGPTGALYLTRGERFALPPKIYGDVDQKANRIIRTFFDRPGVGTGALFSGDKGSGKSLLAKVIATRCMDDHDMPVILVNAPFGGDGFNQFIQHIDQPAVVLFDEFEKVYGPANAGRGDDEEDHSKRSGQDKILTLLDGVYPSHKLFLFTVNNHFRVNENMMDRPGRVYYFLEFRGLDDSFVREYCQDRLIKPGKYAKSLETMNKASRFTFDQLQAVVEELNRYDEGLKSAMAMLNVRPSISVSFHCWALLSYKGTPVPIAGGDKPDQLRRRLRAQPLAEKVHFQLLAPKKRKAAKKAGLVEAVAGVVSENGEAEEFDPPMEGTTVKEKTLWDAIAGTPEDEDGDRMVVFGPEDLETIDIGSGFVTYRKGDWTAELREIVEREFDYDLLLDRD